MRKALVITSLVTLTACEMATFKSIDPMKWNSAVLASLKKDVTGFADSNIVERVKSVELDVESQSLILSLPLPNVTLEGFSKEVAELPGALIENFKKSNDVTGITAKIPLKYLFQKDLYRGKKKLGNGEPIPFIGSAPLEAVKLNVPKLDGPLTIYIGKAAVALHVPVPYDATYVFSLPVVGHSLANKLGYVTTIPKTNDSPSAVVLAVKIPPKVAQSLGKNVE